jgi:hypothetical protein
MSAGYAHINYQAAEFVRILLSRRYFKLHGDQMRVVTPNPTNPTQITAIFVTEHKNIVLHEMLQ